MSNETKVSEFFYTPASTSKKGSRIITVLQVLVVLSVVFVLMYLVFFQPNQVDGQSMEPNFHDKELYFTDKTITWLGKTPIGQQLKYNYGRGDVITFPHSNSAFIKRIVAVGGDRVMLKDNNLYVNGKLIKESYIPEGRPTRTVYISIAFLQEGQEVTVPEGNYFVLGDNRENSKDSRFSDVGFIPRDMILGRVLFRFWPLDRIGLIPRGEYTEISQ